MPACDGAILVAVGMPDILVQDGSGGDLRDFGILGSGTDDNAVLKRDLGLLLAKTSSKFKPSCPVRIRSHPTDPV